MNIAVPDIGTLFPIPSQTSAQDKRFLLQTIALAKRILGSFSYLEIGFYLGGSLTPFLLDPVCKAVLSIDERGRQQPDERGAKYDYSGITHQTMINNLVSRGVPTSKLTTFDGSVDSVQRAESSFEIAFIDGEHTDIACFRDFLWTLPLMKSDAVIRFHDSTLVYKALRMIGLYMQKSGQRHLLAKNRESDVTAFFTGKFAEIDFAREFGRAADWDEFFERSRNGSHPARSEEQGEHSIRRGRYLGQDVPRLIGGVRERFRMGRG